MTKEQAVQTLESEIRELELTVGKARQILSESEDYYGHNSLDEDDHWKILYDHSRAEILQDIIVDYMHSLDLSLKNLKTLSN